MNLCSSSTPDGPRRLFAKDVVFPPYRGARILDLDQGALWTQESIQIRAKLDRSAINQRDGWLTTQRRFGWTMLPLT